MKVKFDVKLNTPNVNGNIHTIEGMTKAVEEYQKVIREGKAVGGIGIWPSIEIDFAKISHRINSLEVIDDELVADIEILTTPMGERLESMNFDDLRFVPFGVGELDEDRNIINYRLISLDFIYKKDGVPNERV